MRKAIITVGLGFGDEGKGSIVDYLCNTQPVDLVVRYSGGCQCGHSVVLPDGRSHVFSQFGAGTLSSGAPTYLHSNVIVDIPALGNEAKGLKELGVSNPLRLIGMHRDCLVTTPYHVAYNRIRERKVNHGSCGMGIGATREYELRHGLDAITVGDFEDPPLVHKKLDLLRRRLLSWAVREGLDSSGLELQLHSDYVRQCEDILEEVWILPDDRLLDFELAVFEGAQGTLLDEWYGFHPYTTWSSVTAITALNVAREMEIGMAHFTGITRCYHTRHGAGPFPTFREEVRDEMGTTPNPWQGVLRVGPFDKVLHDYAIDVNKGLINSVSVTHLDNPRFDVFCKTYQEGFNMSLGLEHAMPVFEKRTGSLHELVKQPILVRSFGPTRDDKMCGPLHFSPLGERYEMED